MDQKSFNTMASETNFDIYKKSDNLFKNEQTIKLIINGSQKECGPYDTLEEALKRIKPDEFVPFCKDSTVSEPFCPEDPGKWWVVTKIPPCFSWLNGRCSRKDCGFNHGKTTFIRVSVVNTPEMFRKRINKNRKIRLNSMKKKYKYYLDIFTEEKIPIYYTNGPKETFNKTKELNTQVANELKSVGRVMDILTKTKELPKKDSWADMCDDEVEEQTQHQEQKKTYNNWVSVVCGNK